MFGFVEIITLLLGLQNFGIQANPAAPTADQSLQYAMPDADVVVHFDAASIIPGNYKALTQLADQPQIKASPELTKMVRQVINEVEGARGLAKGTTGIDVTTDVTDVTMFAQIVPGRDPNALVAVRGKLTPAIVDKVAAAVGQKPTKVGAGAMVALEGKGEAPSLAVTKDGVMLVGSTKLVKDRLAAGWKAPARAAGSNLSYVADVINAKPVFAVVFTMSSTARKEATAKLGPSKNFLTDVIARHKVAAISVFRDGVGWTWVDSSKSGLDAMAMMSEGTVEVMRAAQIAPRGFAKIVLGALDSYKGTSKQVDEVIKRKADIMKIVDAYTGDGNFKVQLDKDPKALRLNVRVTGKTLSEVLPASMILPGAMAAVMMRGKTADTSYPTSTGPVAPAPRPVAPKPKKP